MIYDNFTSIIYFSGLLPSKCPNLYHSITETLNEHHVSFGLLNKTKDIWCRDYMPIQIGSNRFVFYKYNPDYLQTPYYRRTITDIKNIDNIIWEDKKEFCVLDLVIDGGNVVKCGNRIVMTDKVFVENDDKPRQEVIKLLEDAFQCEVVFLPWDKNEIFGHSDGIVHYIGNNNVLMTNYHDFDPKRASLYLKILKQHFNVIILNYDVKRKNKNSWAYINFLQTGRLALIPQLGIAEDSQALQLIAETMPDYKVIGIPAHEAVRKGGALNCISWEIQQ